MADEAAKTTPREHGRKSIGAILLVVLGAVANVVGIAGAVKAWGSTTTVIAVAAPPTASSSTTTTKPKPPETPAGFIAELDRAIRSRDEAFLFARLHPAVIERYGEGACRTFLGTLRAHFVVRGAASAPESYAYTTDGKTTNVAAVVAIPVTISQPGTRSTDTTVHTVPVDGTYRFFTDCTPNPSG